MFKPSSKDIEHALRVINTHDTSDENGFWSIVKYCVELQLRNEINNDNKYSNTYK